LTWAALTRWPTST